MLHLIFFSFTLFFSSVFGMPGDFDRYHKMPPKAYDKLSLTGKVHFNQALVDIMVRYNKENGEFYITSDQPIEYQILPLDQISHYYDDINELERLWSPRDIYQCWLGDESFISKNIPLIPYIRLSPQERELRNYIEGLSVSQEVKAILYAADLSINEMQYLMNHYRKGKNHFFDYHYDLENTYLRKKLVENISICASEHFSWIVSQYPEFQESYCTSLIKLYSPSYEFDVHIGFENYHKKKKSVRSRIDKIQVQKINSPFKNRKGPIKLTEFLALSNLDNDTQAARRWLCYALNNEGHTFRYQGNEYFEAHFELLTHFELYQHSEFHHLIYQFDEYDDLVHAIVYRINNDADFAKQMRSIPSAYGSNLFQFFLIEADRIRALEIKRNNDFLTRRSISNFKEARSFVQEVLVDIDKSIAFLDGKELSQTLINQQREIGELRELVSNSLELMKVGAPRSLNYLKKGLDSLSFEYIDMTELENELRKIQGLFTKEELSILSKPHIFDDIDRKEVFNLVMCYSAPENIEDVKKHLGEISNPIQDPNLSTNVIGNCLKNVYENIPPWRSFFSEETLSAAQTVIKLEPEQLDDFLKNNLVGDNQFAHKLLELSGVSSHESDICQIARFLYKHGFEDKAELIAATTIAESHFLVGVAKGLPEGIVSGYVSQLPHNLFYFGKDVVTFLFEASCYNDDVHYLAMQALVTGDASWLDLDDNPSLMQKQNIRNYHENMHEGVSSAKAAVKEYLSTASAEDWGHDISKLSGEMLAWNNSIYQFETGKMCGRRRIDVVKRSSLETLDAIGESVAYEIQPKLLENLEKIDAKAAEKLSRGIKRAERCKQARSRLKSSNSRNLRPHEIRANLKKLRDMTCQQYLEDIGCLLAERGLTQPESIITYMQALQAEGLSTWQISKIMKTAYETCPLDSFLFKEFEAIRLQMPQVSKNFIGEGVRIVSVPRMPVMSGIEAAIATEIEFVIPPQVLLITSIDPIDRAAQISNLRANMDLLVKECVDKKLNKILKTAFNDYHQKLLRPICDAHGIPTLKRFHEWVPKELAEVMPDLLELEILAKPYKNARLSPKIRKFEQVPFSMDLQHIFNLEMKMDCKKGRVEISGLHHDYMGRIEKSGILDVEFIKDLPGGATEVVVGYGPANKRCGMFPQDWSRSKVIEKALEAYDNQALVVDSSVSGRLLIYGQTKEEMPILWVLETVNEQPTGKVISIYPVTEIPREE